jgi:hypothetical protein
MAIKDIHDVEFNDSLLDLEGWKNPRTEGSKVTGQFINYYNEGDKTYGKNPVIENKIAALYLGNTIIGGDDEDASRVSITGHSYVSIDRVLIIDIDTDEVEIIDRINMNPQAFRRMVQTDLSEFSRVNVKLLDFSTQNNIKPSHFVKFNQGSLMKIYNYEANELGYEDGVFGGYKVRENQLDGNDQQVELYGKTATVGTSVFSGCFSYGMTACVSHSLFTLAPEITSQSIDAVTEITQSIIIQQYHPNPYTFVPVFPTELNSYKGDVTMATLGNELSPCSASIDTTINIGLNIDTPYAMAGFSSGPASSPPVTTKILCQEFYDQGLMSQDIYEADELYGELVTEKDPELMKGYWIWATTAVNFCRAHPFFTKVLYKTLGKPWAEHMAFLVGKREIDNPFGRLLMDTGKYITKKMYKLSTLAKVSQIGYQNN